VGQVGETVDEQVTNRRRAGGETLLTPTSKQQTAQRWCRPLPCSAQPPTAPGDVTGS
jgi:hypothetical protein